MRLRDSAAYTLLLTIIIQSFYNCLLSVWKSIHLYYETMRLSCLHLYYETHLYYDYTCTTTTPVLWDSAAYTLLLTFTTVCLQPARHWRGFCYGLKRLPFLPRLSGAHSPRHSAGGVHLVCGMHRQNVCVCVCVFVCVRVRACACMCVFVKSGGEWKFC